MKCISFETFPPNGMVVSKNSETRHIVTVVSSKDRTYNNYTSNPKSSILRVVGHAYCAAIKECADLGFMVN